MAQGKLLWRRESNNQDDLLVFDAGYEADTAELHIYTKEASVTVSDAKEQIQSSEHIPTSNKEHVDGVPRELLAGLLLKAKTGREPSVSWDVETPSQD